MANPFQIRTATHPLSPLLNLAAYSRDCVEAADPRQSGYLDFKRGAAKGGYVDASLFSGQESILTPQEGRLVVETNGETNGQEGGPANGQDDARTSANGQAGEDAVGQTVGLTSGNGDAIGQTAGLTSGPTSANGQASGRPVWAAGSWRREPGSSGPLLPSPGGESRFSSARRIELAKKVEETPIDVIRRLHGLLQANPHGFECVYGALLLEGSTPAGAPVHSPLLIVPVGLHFDAAEARFRIEPKRDEALLNLQVLGHLFTASRRAVEDLREYERIPLPIDPSVLEAIIQILGTFSTRQLEISDELKADPLLTASLETQTRARRPMPIGKYRLSRTASLAVVRHSNDFVLDDLEQLSKKPPETFEGTLLARLTTSGEALHARDAIPLLAPKDAFFPFPANREQAEVAAGVGRHPLIQVQGPPGTGKSQTIANLVCDAVARGKRVLVVSQNQKAVEVVQENYLEKLGIEFLSTPLLGADSELIETLQQKCDALLQFASSVSREELRGEISGTEQRTQSLRQKIFDLERDLAHALRFQAASWGETSKSPGELAREYNSLESSDFPPEQEAVYWEERGELLRLLEEAVGLFREVRGAGNDAESLFENSSEGRGEQGGIPARELIRIQSALEEAARLCPGAQREQIRQSTLYRVCAGYSVLEMEGLKRRFSGQALRLENLRSSEAGQSALRTVKAKPVEQYRITMKAVKAFRSALPRWRACEESAPETSFKVSTTGLASALESYQRGSTGARALGSRELTDSRKILAEALGRYHLLPNSDLSGIVARLEGSQYRDALAELWAGYLSDLPIPEVPHRLDSLTERRLSAACMAIEEALAEAYEARQFADRNAEWAGDVDLLDYESTSGLAERIAGAGQLLGANELEDQSRKIIRSWKGPDAAGVAGVLAEAIECGDADQSRRLAEAASRREGISDSYCRLIGLLEGPLARWKATAKDCIQRFHEREAGDLRRELSSLVYAKALGAELHLARRGGPPDAAQVARELRQSNDEYMKAVRDAVAARLHHQVAVAASDSGLLERLGHFAGQMRDQKGRGEIDPIRTLKSSPEIFRTLLSVFPCWVASLTDLARVVPLEPHLFDLVIVDEASQCAIPAALPILLRAGKAVIIGDDKQLPSADLKILDRKQNERLILKHGLTFKLPRAACFDARESTLFDLGHTFADERFTLLEHFRCHPDIASFSNHQFYEDQLMLMTYGMGRRLGSVCEVIEVAEGKDDRGAGVNEREAHALVQHLRQLIDDPAFEGLDFAACSPFASQAELIWKKICAEFSDREIQERKLLSATPEGLQGDERDVLLYSFRYAENSSPLLLHIGFGEEGAQRINVAFTRPRRKAICFVSRPIEQFPPGLVRDALIHFADPKATRFQNKPWNFSFEQDMLSHLESKGLKVQPQIDMGRYTVDFLVEDGQGRVAAIEADGWNLTNPGEWPPDEELQRQRDLERAGWPVFRVQADTFYLGADEAMKDVAMFFERAHSATRQQIPTT